jgi:hypothetical protein
VSTFQPFEAGQVWRPSYYRPVRRNARIAPDADVWDIAHGFELDPMIAMALKYLLRAGKKPGEPLEKDLTKALECIQRRLLLAHEASEANE